MSFVEIQFPTTISRNSQGGPVRLTDIVSLRSGYERRNAVWASSKRKYDAGLGIRNVSDATGTNDSLYDAYEFFEAREARLIGFRWKDWLDFKSGKPNHPVLGSDQALATGDGVTSVFQLRKSYSSGGAVVVREIKKPVTGTVVVHVDGAPAAVTTDYTVGTVTFTSPPSNGSLITAGFEFDVPARFDTDAFMVNLDHFDLGDVPDLKVIEIRI